MLLHVLLGTALAGDTYKVDTGHSGVLFKALHFGAGYTWGRFNEFEGSFVSDGKTLSSIEVTVQAESVDTNIKKRDDHLRSPDYLDAEQFPTVSFKSSSCDAKGCTGELSLHGVTQEVTLPIAYVGEGSDPWGGYRQGWDAAFTVKMADFGIDGAGAVGDELHLFVSLEGKK
jgi:polyisoprenoid-binding protein YceI